MSAPDHDKLAALIRLDEPDELWDLYDEAGNRTGRIQRRGDPFREGDRHLCVHVWVRNMHGDYLITKRAPNKVMPGLWECTGGSALLGEDSLTAALREAREETGLALDPENGELLFRFSGEHFYCDVWRFTQDFSENDIVLQPGETCSFQIADAGTLRRLDREGCFFAFEDLARVLTWEDGR